MKAKRTYRIDVEKSFSIPTILLILVGVLINVFALDW